MKKLIHSTENLYSRFVIVGCILLLLGCVDEVQVKTSNPISIRPSDVSESQGKLFYERLRLHALDDPFRGHSSSTRQILTTEFEKLKSEKEIDYEMVLDQAVTDGRISKIVKDLLLTYNRDILAYAEANPEVDKVTQWCSDRSNIIKSRKDLSDPEKEGLLLHQSLIKHFIKYSLESMPAFSDNKSARAMGGWKDIWCYLGCAVKNISSFSSVGGLAGPTGKLIGAGAGLIYTIIYPSGCNCGNSQACGYATGVSCPDVCYSASDGLNFSAWGYGQTPSEFLWEFYRDDLSNAPVRRTSSDEYRLTDAELNGASKVAVRLSTNCAGTYFYSTHYWTSPQDNGKPRPIVTAYEIGNNQVQYILSGDNIYNYQWSYIPPYRGSVIYQNGSTIFVQWQAGLRIGVNVDTSSPCGIASGSTY